MRSCRQAMQSATAGRRMPSGTPLPDACGYGYISAQHIRFSHRNTRYPQRGQAGYKPFKPANSLVPRANRVLATWTNSGPVRTLDSERSGFIQKGSAFEWRVCSDRALTIDSRGRRNTTSFAISTIIAGRRRVVAHRHPGARLLWQPQARRTQVDGPFPPS